MKRNIKNRIAESFELPKEIILDVPKLRLISNSELTIENHKGIVEYNTNLIRINSNIGVIAVGGDNLQVKEINHESVIISGEILKVEYVV